MPSLNVSISGCLNNAATAGRTLRHGAPAPFVNNIITYARGRGTGGAASFFNGKRKKKTPASRAIALCALRFARAIFAYRHRGVPRLKNDM